MEIERVNVRVRGGLTTEKKESNWTFPLDIQDPPIFFFGSRTIIGGLFGRVIHFYKTEKKKQLWKFPIFNLL